MGDYLQIGCIWKNCVGVESFWGSGPGRTKRLSDYQNDEEGMQ